MRRDLVTSTISILALTLLLGIVFPLLITGISQLAFPGNANGQKVYVNGKLVGSRIIGQSFERPVIGTNGRPEEKEQKVVTEPDASYFQSRPSATEGGAYNAAASTFSNRGPNGRNTEQADAEYVKSYVALNKPYDPALTVAQVPVDAVSTSGSNLDPQISPANARIQTHRVAGVRHLPLAVVDGLVSKYTSGRGLGFSGEPGVNVLELNLALNRLSGGTG